MKCEPHRGNHRGAALTALPATNFRFRWFAVEGVQSGLKLLFSHLDLLWLHGIISVLAACFSARYAPFPLTPPSAMISCAHVHTRLVPRESSGVWEWDYKRTFIARIALGPFQYTTLKRWEEMRLRACSQADPPTFLFLRLASIQQE